MSNVSPMKLVSRNVIPQMTLGSNESTTSGLNLDFLKNEFRAEVAGWPAQTNFLVIDGTMNDYFVADALVFLHHTLQGDCTAAVNIYDGAGLTGDLIYTSTIERVSQQIPIGEWRIGVDPIGTSGLENSPFIIWFDQPYVGKSFRVLLTWDDYGNTKPFEIKQLFLGYTTQLSQCHSWGDSMKHTLPPTLTTTANGSAITDQQQIKAKSMMLDLAQLSDEDRRLLTEFELSLNGDAFVVSALPDHESVWLREAYSFQARFADSLEYSRQFLDWQQARKLIFKEV